jgi:hypothetical protein
MHQTRCMSTGKEAVWNCSMVPDEVNLLMVQLLIVEQVLGIAHLCSLLTACVAGGFRSAVAHTRLVLPTRMGGPHAITVRSRLQALGIAFCSATCSPPAEQQSTARSSNQITSSLATSTHGPARHACRLQSPQAGTSRTNTGRAELTSLSDLAQGSTGGLLAIEPHKLQDATVCDLELTHCW